MIDKQTLSTYRSKRSYLQNMAYGWCGTVHTGIEDRPCLANLAVQKAAAFYGLEFMKQVIVWGPEDAKN